MVICVSTTMKKGFSQRPIGNIRRRNHCLRSVQCTNVNRRNTEISPIQITRITTVPLCRYQYHQKPPMDSSWNNITRRLKYTQSLKEHLLKTLQPYEIFSHALHIRDRKSSGLLTFFHKEKLHSKQNISE